MQWSVTVVEDRRVMKFIRRIDSCDNSDSSDSHGSSDSRQE